MTYKFKRAFGISLLLYIATFVTGIICGLISGQDMSSMNNIPDSFWYIGMVGAVVLTTVFSLWYFRSKEIIASARSGAWFGLTAVIISFLLDIALFSLGNTGGAEVDLSVYFGDFRYWIIIVLVVGTAKIVGWRKGGRLV